MASHTLESSCFRAPRSTTNHGWIYCALLSCPYSIAFLNKCKPLIIDQGTASEAVNSTHHTFQPLCVCGFGLLQPVVFRAGLPVPQPLPAAPHAPAPDAAALVVVPVVPHPPAEGDAPEPEPPPHAVPPPVGEAPQPPPLPPPPGVPAVAPHPDGLAASCPHPAALGGAACAGIVPLAGGSCAAPSPARASSSVGSDLSPRTRFASFVCSSVRPCGVIIFEKICVIISHKIMKNDSDSAPSSRLPVGLDFRPSLPQSRIFGASHCSRTARRRAEPLLLLRLYLKATPV